VTCKIQGSIAVYMDKMGDLPRYIPEDSLVEVTTRTLHGRFLLRPSRDLNDIISGIIAKAAERYEVGVVHFVVLSNHVHLALIPKDAQALAGFMCYVNGNIAKEAGRLHEWRQRLWSRRYRAIVVSHEPEAQVSRLRYLLEQGCKEGLVRSPREWPGASGTEALLTGKPIRGLWFDRTAEYEARRRGSPFGKYTHAHEVSFELAPLPCWRALTPSERQRRAAAMVREIERETRERLHREGRSPLGRRRIERLHPHEAPRQSTTSPAPRFHAHCPSIRKGLELAFHEFLCWYRQASEDLRAGKRGVEFPPGCFLPRLPFNTRHPPPLAAQLALSG
jgi:REP element-mobilizing transposase RayT